MHYVGTRRQTDDELPHSTIHDAANRTSKPRRPCPDDILLPRPRVCIHSKCAACNTRIRAPKSSSHRSHSAAQEQIPAHMQTASGGAPNPHSCQQRCSFFGRTFGTIFGPEKGYPKALFVLGGRRHVTTFGPKLRPAFRPFFKKKRTPDALDGTESLARIPLCGPPS